MRRALYIILTFALVSCLQESEYPCADGIAYTPFDKSRYLPIQNDSFVYEATIFNKVDTVTLKSTKKNITAQYGYKDCSYFQDVILTEYSEEQYDIKLSIKYESVHGFFDVGINNLNGKTKLRTGHAERDFDGKVFKNQVFRFHIDSGLTHYDGSKFHLKLIR